MTTKGNTQYDDFFAWLDGKVPSFTIPKLFPELEGLEIKASDLVAELHRYAHREGKKDYYCDVLYEAWLQHQRGRGAGKGQLLDCSV